MGYLKELETKFRGLLDSLKEEFSSLRTNRPTPKLVENIKVDHLGSELMVKELGATGIEPPRDILITVWDKNAVSPIIKAIEAANVGLSLSNEGNVIRAKLPELTTERRTELLKVVKASAEKTRIKMRTLRDEVNRLANKEPDKDQKFRAKEELQKIVDSFNNEVDSLVESKAKEIEQ